MFRRVEFKVYSHAQGTWTSVTSIDNADPREDCPSDHGARIVLRTDLTGGDGVELPGADIRVLSGTETNPDGSAKITDEWCIYRPSVFVRERQIRVEGFVHGANGERSKGERILDVESFPLMAARFTLHL